MKYYGEIQEYIHGNSYNHCQIVTLHLQPSMSSVAVHSAAVNRIESFSSLVHRPPLVATHGHATPMNRSRWATRVSHVIRNRNRMLSARGCRAMKPASVSGINWASISQLRYHFMLVFNPLLTPVTLTVLIGVNSYWAQGLKPPPLLWSWGSPIWRAPHFCDVILYKLCFNCSHWFYAMPTNRQLDHSFPAVLDIFGKGLNLPAPLDIQWPTCFQLHLFWQVYAYDSALAPYKLNA